MQLPSDNSFIATEKRFHSLLDPKWGEQEVKAILAVLCREYLGWNRADIVMNRKNSLSESELLRFHYALKDLLKDRPVQYIVGHTLFYGCDIHVNEHVLIPRPETEELVNLVLQNNSLEHPRILDIGTGSGCIPIALGINIPGATILAWDVSENALDIARENARVNSVAIQYRNVDILTVSDAILEEHSLDILVSNPPYVLKRDAASMQKNVLEHEPHLALFVEDEDPLLFYRVIGTKALKWLRTGAHLYFEIHEDQSEGMIQLMESMGYTQVLILNDLQGRPRMLQALRP